MEDRAAASALRVLVVEDYTDARECLCALLKLWGYACESASTGPDALRAASTFQPDVVLMDLGLPAPFDGYSTAREIRKRMDVSGTTFVAMTGYGRMEDFQRSRKEGFIAHLLKAADPAELEELLTHCTALFADTPRRQAGT